MSTTETTEDIGRKAYKVEMISRAVDTVLVYADSVEEAKYLCECGEFEELGSTLEAKGFGKVRLARESR